MYPWWPKVMPVELAPVFRTLGRKARYGELTVLTDVPAGLSNHSRPLTFGGDLSLKEQGLLRRTPGEIAFLLGKVLADGVKYFEIPSGFEALNEIEIPLSVRDYVQPFPAVVVKADKEHHLVVQDSSSLFIGTFDDTMLTGNCEWLNMFSPERSIESYLTDQLVVAGLPGMDCSVVLHEPEALNHHRFRATLNFLLICTMEGVLAASRASSPTASTALR